MRLIFLLLFSCVLGFQGISQNSKRAFDYMDVFDLEYASNPKISPNGKSIVYERHSYDIMIDKKVNELWIVDEKGENHRKLSSLQANESKASWSYDGKRIAFVASTEEGNEIFIYWLDKGSLNQLTQLESSPSSITWSPDDSTLAFSMFEATKAPNIIKALKKPTGANWAESPRLTTRLKHEADGKGYLKDGFHHIYTINSNGGPVRKMTSGDYNHRGQISWTKDNKEIVFSANRDIFWEYQFVNSNIYKVNVNSKEITQISANNGPEKKPVVSPDGRKIAYLSFDDKVRTYQVMNVLVMNVDGSQKENWTSTFDRSITDIKWRKNSKGLFITYDDKGNTKIARLSNAGFIQNITSNVGGTTIGRPYPSGAFDVSEKEQIVYTKSTPYHPGELVIIDKSFKKQNQISHLSKWLDKDINLGKVEEVLYKSTVDGREIQGWIIKPPFYEEGKKYPLMVENHGGPILNYGDRFTAELQLYASKGYVVFYPNPRGSTSYGEAFGDLLYNNYPGDDYQDVMDGVDYLLDKGFTSEEQLFVVGGSAGGIMTAWMIGKNNRFEAAVVHKPVMNWISKTLVADNYYGYANYRYPGQPWENFETYWKFSPVSLLGNIETPTMVMVGMNDLRTPPSEAKQLYHGLKLRKIETMLVEIPGASHGIASRPSNLITKVAHTIAWCDKFKK